MKIRLFRNLPKTDPARIRLGYRKLIGRRTVRLVWIGPAIFIITLRRSA